MRIHILGICGTFMGSMALIARELGHDISGSDENVYPPMSDQLAQAGIRVVEGYDPAILQPAPDLVVIGNAMGRGNPCVEYVLNQGLPFMSGPEWFARQVLTGRHVLGVAGTHGKTTTTSMLAWVLEHAGLKPGFLIGGVTGNFASSARLGAGEHFVIEADEYDSAFFDKRSKFIHYRPRTLVLNNLEYDHADIFPDLASIQRQFHHLIRTIPSDGQILCSTGEPALDQVLDMGRWTPVTWFGTDQDPRMGWCARLLDAAGSTFEVMKDGVKVGEVSWKLAGEYNVRNALAALVAAVSVGVSVGVACEGLGLFKAPKRRMELLGSPGGIDIYDDFAHHPTAIQVTLEAARARFGQRPLWVILEPRSNTMKMGIHQGALAGACGKADRIIWFKPAGLDWDLQTEAAQGPVKADVMDSLDSIVDTVVRQAQDQAVIIVMSNGGFGGIHKKLLAALAAREASCNA